MDRSPNFEAGPLDQMLDELARFYRGLGYLVEQAYRRVGGLCACGDEACRKNPHFATEKIPPAASHLVMRAEAALSTCDMGVLQLATRFGAVPILRHGNTSYLFVSEPKSFPDVYPVLGPARGWIALPPQRSDAPDGRSAMPSWISPLSLPPKDLSPAVDVFGPSALSRMEQLSVLGAQLWRFAGEGAITNREIISAACEELFATTGKEEAVTFLGACCVGKMITTTDAASWITARADLFSDEREMSDSLNKAIAGVILSDGAIATDEMKELLETTAVRLAGVDEKSDEDSDEEADEHSEGDSDEDWSPLSNTGGNREDGPRTRHQDVEYGDLRGDIPESIERFEVPRETQAPDQGETVNPVGSPNGSQMDPRPVVNRNIPPAQEHHRSEGGSRPSGAQGGMETASFAATNWADALERQESLLFSAALALFTPTGGVAGPIERIVRSDHDIDRAEQLLPEVEPEIEPATDAARSETDEAQVELPATSDDPRLDESDAVLTVEATPGSEPEYIPDMREIFSAISVPLDWRGALASVEDTTVAPVALVQILLDMDELDFDDDPMTKLALLDLAITTIPDGTDDPLALFPYLWSESGAVMSDFSQHRILVELLAGLLLRFDMACSAGVLMGDVSLVSLFAQDPLGTVSDLVGDPELVFWLERHLINVTTRDQLGTRLQTISKIISVVGNDVMGDVSTEHLRSLLGGAINE